MPRPSRPRVEVAKWKVGQVVTTARSVRVSKLSSGTVELLPGCHWTILEVLRDEDNHLFYRLGCLSFTKFGDGGWQYQTVKRQRDIRALPPPVVQGK